MFSPMIIQVAFLSVNCGLNVNPSFVKNAIDLFRFFTGRLRYICFAIGLDTFAYLIILLFSSSPPIATNRC